ncbi:MAG: hypothetical protein V4507_06075 [Verrucomicrobiota bacterium]
MKNIFKIFGILFLLALLFLFKEYKEVQFNDGRISYGAIYRPILCISPHISPRSYLSVNGKIYKDVYGVPPYYIKDDQEKYLIFVTKVSNDNSEKKQVHFLNLKDDFKAEINVDSSYFGWDIGTKNDFATILDSDRVMLVSDGLSDRKETLIINLKTKTLESKNTEKKVRRSNWDQDGNEIK